MAFNLSNHAVLVSFNVTRPKLSKVDKELTREQKENHGVVGDRTLKTTKELYGEELKQIEAAIWQARKDHYAMSLGWVADGAQLLPSKMYMRYTQRMREHKQHVETLVRDLDFQEMLTRRAVKLNGTFRRDEYPSEDEFKRGYGFTISITPVPETSTFNQISDMIDADMLIAEHEARMVDATQNAMKDLWQKLFDAVQHVAITLKNGYCGRVHESLIGNVVAVVDILPLLNISDDPALKHMAQQVRESLCCINSDSLKKDESRQKETARKAQEILDAMSGYMGMLS